MTDGSDFTPNVHLSGAPDRELAPIALFLTMADEIVLLTYRAGRFRLTPPLVTLGVASLRKVRPRLDSCVFLLLRC